MYAFSPGLPARQVHDRLQKALVELSRAEHNAVLWFAEVAGRRLYRELGYSSVHLYASEALGFSKSKTSQFVRLSEALEDLPAVRQSLAAGEIGWTKARELVKVATPKNEQRWLARARKSSRRELERQVTLTRGRAKAARNANPQQPVLGACDGTAPGGALPDRASPRDGASPGDKIASLADYEAGSLEQEAAADLPVAVSLRFSPTQFARFEAQVEKIRKTASKSSGGNGNSSASRAAHPAAGLRGASREDLVLFALDELLASVGQPGGSREEQPGGLELGQPGGPEHGQPREVELGQTDGPSAEQPTGPEPEQPRGRKFTRVNSRAGNTTPYQIVIYECESCGAGHVRTSRGAKKPSASALAATSCDARVLGPGAKNRATIPPAKRRAVLARDGHQCQVKGCGNTRFLEVHHKVPRARGGTNDLDNLTTACSRCHQLVHEHGHQLLKEA